MQIAAAISPQLWVHPRIDAVGDGEVARRAHEEPRPCAGLGERRVNVHRAGLVPSSQYRSIRIEAARICRPIYGVEARSANVLLNRGEGFHTPLSSIARAPKIFSFSQFPTWRA